MITQDLRPYFSTPAEPPITFLGLPTVVRATAQTTNGAFGLIEHLTIRAGFASPYHTHRLEDEAWYILEGQVAFVCDGKWTVAGPGTFVFGPRNIPHGFRVEGDTPVRMLLLCAPGGFEQFVLEMSKPGHEPLPQMAAKYHVDVHGPLPARPSTSVEATST